MRRRRFLTILLATLLNPGAFSTARAEVANRGSFSAYRHPDDHIRDYLYKMKHFDERHAGDFQLERNLMPVLESAAMRLDRLQKTVGYGNFCLLDFDDALSVARNYASVGPFPKAELDFLEKIFHQDGTEYGFLGAKPLCGLTDRIKREEAVKIPGTGNYLFKGPPLETYHRIKGDIGEKVILTSGVRSLIKQFYLFLNKALECDGNLSQASRSLAPPGYSYHAVGDFDVGQTGYGTENFTNRFTVTEVFKRLEDLGYVCLRYTAGNHLGVRYEPWHIQVITTPS